MPTDDVREAAAPIISDAVHNRLCSKCDRTAGSGLTIRDLDADRAATAVLDALQAAGWQLAPPGSVVVQLPEPEPFDREFCTAARFGSGIEASIRCDGDVSIDSWMETYRSAKHARRRAAALLAAAAWVDAREATPAPGGAA